MPDLSSFILKEVSIYHSNGQAAVSRSGCRALLDCTSTIPSLSHHLAGQIPYYYRAPEKIASDFSERHNALDMVIDLAIKAPTTPKFRQSHAGEILCALYCEEVLKLKRLYSKLTLTTSANTNVHKMDAFFVDSSVTPYRYFAVEAKSSILPTPKTQFRGHRYGILKQMLASLEGYDMDDRRFDFTVIRDNLERAQFSSVERESIRKDLIPPGPANLFHIGMATINEPTVDQDDDDYILRERCSCDFDFRCLVVSDLAALAKTAYDELNRLKHKS